MVSYTIFLTIQIADESLFRYAELPCFDLFGFGDNAGMLKSCIWKGQEFPCKLLFQNVPTDQGMCCSFNMKKAEEMFKESQYQKLILKMQSEDFKQSIPLNIDNFDFRDNQWTPEAGRNKGLQLVLDAHAEKVSGGTIHSDFDGFYATIGPKDQYPLTMRKSILIRPGCNNFVSLEATKITSDENMKKIDVDQRNCIFTDEMKLYFHKNYSKSNCDLEVSMIYAISQVL